MSKPVASPCQKRKNPECGYRISRQQLSVLRDAFTASHDIVILFDAFSLFRVEDMIDDVKDFFRESHYQILDFPPVPNMISRGFAYRKPVNKGDASTKGTCTFKPASSPLGSLTSVIVVGMVLSHDQKQCDLLTALENVQNSALVHEKTLHLLYIEEVGKSEDDQKKYLRPQAQS